MRRTIFLTGIAGLGIACATVGDETSTGEHEAVASTVNVLTSRYDANRTGANTEETILTPGNVKRDTFGKVYSRFVDGQVYAQPLYVSNVGGKNVVYIATEHNSVYAFDADDTRADAAPLWTKNYGPSQPASDTGCGLLAPEIGITSTPVIDAGSKTMWFTSRHKENGKSVHRLHAIDIASGEERANSPTVITAQAKGTGTTSVNGVITFDPLKHMQRPGVLKVGNRIYLGFASQCDRRPYHGWLLGYDATTLAQTAVHITTPNGGEGGIWNGGAGLNADENGDVYYLGADAYDTSGQTPWNGKDSHADSIVRVRETGNTFQVVTSFTPFDAPQVSPEDRSIGNGGGILIPGTNLFVTGDKRGVNFLVNRDDMGGTAAQDRQIIQKWQGTDRGSWGGGAYYKQGAGGTYYIWGNGDRLKAYHFNGRTFDTPAAVNPSTLVGYPGGALSISANGETPGTAIVWAVRGKRTSSGLNATMGESTLLAFDGKDITKQLYSSDEIASDALGNATKFAPPTVANGKIFVGTSSNQLVVYGLRKGSSPGGSTGTDAGNTTNPDNGSTGPAPTWTSIYKDLFGPQTPGHCSNAGGCHTKMKGGFKCGVSQEECYQGLVSAGLLDFANPAASPLVVPESSPISWFGNGGMMPFDNAVEDKPAAAKLRAWVLAGAKNN